MNTRTYTITLLLGVFPMLAGLAAPAFAAGRDQPEDESAGIPVGETKVYPSVRMEYQGFNNVFFVGDDPEDAAAFLVQPKLSWLADRRLLELRAEYSGGYSNGTEDVLTYDDHNLSFSIKAAPTKRVDIRSTLSLTQTNELLEFNDIGLVDNENARGLLPQTDIQWRSYVNYGANNARGNLRFGFNLRSFDPSDDNVLFLQGRNAFTSLQPSGIFSLRVSPDTRVFVELRTTAYDYKDLDNNLQVNTAFAGLDFSETGVVGGTARLGVSDIQFDNTPDRDDSILVAEVDLFYKPREYSQFFLELERRFDERTTGVAGDESESTELLRGQLEWDYD
ncbi:MAG: outer membrane beta-barrel protein, partial [Granulosicoccus sp.]